MLSDPQSEGKPPSAVPPVDFWQYAFDVCQGVIDSNHREWELIFEIARAVRGHPHADRYRPASIAQKIYRKIGAIQNLVDEEDFLTQFPNCWKKVRLLPGTNPLESAARFAEDHPLGLMPEHSEDATPGYIRFISLAGWLCTVVGTDRIKLPVREVGKALGVRPNTVSCYRQLAVEQGYLHLVANHTYNPSGKGEATEFRFPVHGWKCLSDRMPK